MSGCVARARRDDDLAGAEKLVGDLDGARHDAARVVTQVEDEALGALPLQARQVLAELVVGGLGKVADAQVARPLVGHERALDGQDRDARARDGEAARLRQAHPANRHLHLRADLALERAAHVVVVETDGGRVADHQDAVARHEAHLLAGPVGHRVDDAGGVAYHLEVDAHAAEGALEGLLHLAQLARGDVGRVRIELFEHPRDGPLDERLGVDRLHVLLRDKHEGVLQLAQLAERVGVVGALLDEPDAECEARHDQDDR
jgi:hypothetical protein